MFSEHGSDPCGFCEVAEKYMHISSVLPRWCPIQKCKIFSKI